MNVLIAGGGTGGHLLPGLAVAAELVGRGVPASSVTFVGSRRGPEATAVPEAGFEVTLLPGRGVQRRLAIENIGAVLGLVQAVFMALSLVRRRRPSVILSLGGFASVACSLAALVWRVPLVQAEQNARAGAANRLFARFAAASAVPFDETDLPGATVTGNPVRAAIREVAEHRDRESARAQLGIPPDRRVVAVFAGSLGSRRLNEATYGLVERWTDRADLAIHHVVGARDWDDRPPVASGASEIPDDGRIFYRAIRYEDRMDRVLAAADLAVCRAGGTTVAELAVVGVGAILVPLPIATRDHQRFNAGPLVAAGAAVMVVDADLDTSRLEQELRLILDAPVSDGVPRTERMASAARSLSRPDAAALVADLLLRVAEGASR